MKVLVCGGRDFSDKSLLTGTLDRVHSKYGDALVIVHGVARGADLMAEDWAKAREVAYEGFPAHWKKLGKRAGLERNKRMRDAAKPAACIAFAGGVGTRMMCDLMREIGVEPWLVGWQEIASDAKKPAKQGDNA